MDSETEDEDGEAVQAEFGVEMGHGDVVAAASALYLMIEPEDEETVMRMATRTERSWKTWRI